MCQVLFCFALFLCFSLYLLSPSIVHLYTKNAFRQAKNDDGRPSKNESPAGWGPSGLSTRRWPGRCLRAGPRDRARVQRRAARLRGSRARLVPRRTAAAFQNSTRVFTAHVFRPPPHTAVYRACTALHQGSARLLPVSCQVRAIIATCVANKVKGHDASSDFSRRLCSFYGPAQHSPAACRTEELRASVQRGNSSSLWICE